MSILTIVAVSADTVYGSWVHCSTPIKLLAVEAFTDNQCSQQCFIAIWCASQSIAAACCAVLCCAVLCCAVLC